jgi:hydroxylamine dehydrogenase
MRSIVGMLLCAAMSGLMGTAQAETCVQCHRNVTPGIVDQHLAGRMGKIGIDCASCHGFDHQSADDVAKARMPTAQTCAGCHPKQAMQFKAGKHELAWKAVTAMPMWAHQPQTMVGAGNKGCSGCHKIGAKPRDEAARHRYGNAQCDACHTRHTFSKVEARDPRACQTCHMGFDHPQWEMWSTSKHGTIWQIEGRESKRGPTCQTCHMENGHHGVGTAWGFLALRLPEPDAGWLADRTTILQGLGVLDDQGKPTARLEAVQAARMATLDRAAFDESRARMVAVCAKCHGKTFAERQLAAADDVVRESDRVMAEAIRAVQGLYRDGLLRKPEQWLTAPDILQFYEAKTEVERELYVMFLEYRMRAFQGAFHFNPDYAHWYGWAPLKASAAKVVEAAAKMREEAKAGAQSGK